MNSLRPTNTIAALERIIAATLDEHDNLNPVLDDMRREMTDASNDYATWKWTQRFDALVCEQARLLQQVGRDMVTLTKLGGWK